MKLEAPYDKYPESIELIDSILLAKHTWDDVYADKKLKWTEYLTVLKAAYEAKDGFIGMEKIPAEITQPGALKEIATYFKSVYDDPNDELESLVEDTLDWAVDGFELEKRWEKFFKK